MNQMFMERKVSAQQKRGVIVCMPKSSEQNHNGGLSAHYPVEYGLQNTSPKHRLPIAPDDGGAVTSVAKLRGAGEDHLCCDGDRV